MAAALARLADQPRSQEDRHHVYRPGAGDVCPRPCRGGGDAHPAGGGGGRSGVSLRRAFRPAILDPRFDHDLLHGDALPDRPHQLRHADPDRGAGHELSLHECGEPWADDCRGRAGHDLPGDRQVLHRRLERLSTIHGHRLQLRPRRRLLDLGDHPDLGRLDTDGHQLCRYPLQGTRAGDAPDADAAVLLDGSLHLDPDGVFHDAADAGHADAVAGISASISSRWRRVAT